MNTYRKLIHSCFVSAVCCAFSVVPSRAANSTWITDGGGSWNNSTFWDAGVPGSNTTTDSTDVATFAGNLTANATVTVDANRNVAGITLNETAATYDFTVSGGNIKLSNGGLVQALSTSGDHQDRVSSPLSIQGDGANATIANWGIGNTNGLIMGTINGTSTSGNTTTLYLDGTSTTSSTTGINNSLGVISNGHGGGKVAVVKNGGGVWTFSAGHTFNGGLIINNGTVRIFSNNNALGTGNVTINGGGFNHPNPGVMNLSNNFAVNGDFFLSGQTNVTFSGPMDFNGGTRQITANGPYSIASVISNGTLSKAGSSRLILTGNNTYTGGTIIAAGNLTADHANALGTTGNLTFTGGTLQYTSNSAVNDYVPRIQNSTGSISLDTNGLDFDFTSELNATNTGGLAKSGAGNLTLSVANNHTGVTTVDTGTLYLAHVAALQYSVLDTSGAGSFVFAVPGTNTYYLGGLQGSVDLDMGAHSLVLGGGNASATYTGNLSSTGNLTKTGSGTQTFSRNHTYTGLTTIAQGVVLLNNNTATLGTLDAGTIVQSGGQLRLTATNFLHEENMTLSGPGTGTSGAGNGALGMQINNGILTYNGTLTLDGGATLGTFNAGTAEITIPRGITGTGDLTIRPSAANNGRANFYLLGQSSYTGNTVFSSVNIDGLATIRNRIDNALPTASVLFMNGTASGTDNRATLAYVLNGFNQTLAGLNGGASSTTGNNTMDQFVVGGNASLSTLTINSTYDTVFNGTLGGNGSVTGNATEENNLALVKTGNGTLTLGGDNTGTGTITVLAGTLLVNGNNTAATGNITVAAGAIVGGTGTVGGNVINSGTVSPGKSIGRLTSNADVTLNNGADYIWEISNWNGTAGSGYDQVDINGTIRGSGTTTVRIVENSLTNFSEGNKTFTILTFSGFDIFSIPTIVIDDSGFTSGNGTWAVEFTLSSVKLAYTAAAPAGISFASWAAGYNVTNSTSANDDGDKFTHGEEYAFDLDPTVDEYGNVLASQTALSNGNVTLTLAFSGNSAKSDINYVVRRANNPGFTSNTVVGFWNGTANWTTSNATYFANQTQSGAGDVKAINVNLNIPAASEPRQFLKVDIE